MREEVLGGYLYVLKTCISDTVSFCFRHRASSSISFHEGSYIPLVHPRPVMFELVHLSRIIYAV